MSDPTGPGTSTKPAPKLVAPGEGEQGPSVGPGLPTVEVKLSADAGMGFSVVEYTVPAGFSPPAAAAPSDSRRRRGLHPRG